MALLLREGAWITAAGVGAGLAGAPALSHVPTSPLFGGVLARRPAGGPRAAARGAAQRLTYHGGMEPLTRAEATAWQETSRHADVMAFVRALRDPRVHTIELGRSPEGRELPLLVLSTRGVTTPDDARAAGLPIVLVICGIHAGEVEGKEAGLMLARDLGAGAHPGILDRVTLLLLPLYNPDGNDRIDPKNRALDVAHCEGQIGPPGGVGTRGNAAGINLNRDYLRQQAWESRLLGGRVVVPWEPDLTIDCHATDGSVHRLALTYDTAHTVESGRPEPIRFMRDELLPEVTRRVRAASGRETFFYGNFVDDEGGPPGAEGWMTYPHHPRFGSNYRGLTSRMDLLLETYSYMPFEERVRTTYEFLVESLRLAGERGADIRAVVAASRTPRTDIAVRYRLEADDAPATIPTRRPRSLDGEPVTVTIPHLCRFVGTVVVRRPWAYAVPEAIARHLGRHGLSARALPEPRSAEVEVARVKAAEATESRRILEAAEEREIDVDVSAETRILPAGTWIVPTDQPLGAIAVYLCEARSDDGLVSCGLIAEPPAGSEWPAVRVLAPID